MTDKTSEVLLGRSVLVTRPKDQADSLVMPLTALGAEILFQPAIEIVSRSEESIIADLAKIGMERHFDRIIFSSANGVRSFCQLLKRERYQSKELTDSKEFNSSKELTGFPELRALSDGINCGSIRLAAMGSGTAKTLEEFGLTADLVPSDFHAEGMLEALKNEGIVGRRFLSVRGSRGRSVLREGIRQFGGDLVELSVYESRDLTIPDPEVHNRLRAGSIDAVTVTSSAIAVALVRMFGESLRKSSLFTISPLTSNALRENGFEPAAEAKCATMEELVERIADFFRQ